MLATLMAISFDLSHDLVEILNSEKVSKYWHLIMFLKLRSKKISKITTKCRTLKMIVLAQ